MSMPPTRPRQHAMVHGSVVIDLVKTPAMAKNAEEATIRMTPSACSLMAVAGRADWLFMFLPKALTVPARCQESGGTGTYYAFAVPKGTTRAQCTDEPSR